MRESFWVVQAGSQKVDELGARCGKRIKLRGFEKAVSVGGRSDRMSLDL